MKIYLSRPGQFMDLSGRMGYKIFPGDVIQGGNSKEKYGLSFSSKNGLSCGFKIPYAGLRKCTKIDILHMSLKK